MAIITCPECGQQVSDKAKNCVHCGTPLTIDKKIKVKIPRFCTGMLNQKACEVEVQIDGKTVWSGFCGSVAVFEAEQECNVSFLIKNAYTGHPFPFLRIFQSMEYSNQAKNMRLKTQLPHWYLEILQNPPLCFRK